jgi:hypothetical protein
MRLHAAARIHDRISQVAEIVYNPNPRKWVPLMAEAIGCARPRDLDAFMFHPWTIEQQDEINQFLADLLPWHADQLEAAADAKADGLLANQIHAAERKRIADVRYLAAQLAAPRHRPYVPPAPGAGDDEFSIATPFGPAPADEIPPMPEWYRKGWEALLADD